MTTPRIRPRNWIFLGDSLTEGVGSSRINYVTEFMEILRIRGSMPVDEVRLRRVNPENFNAFLKVNIAGNLNHDDEKKPEPRRWLWNLASEGTTIETDIQWLPLIENLRPERIFILRGALESLVRPAALSDSDWPFWIPHSWRGYAAMDPQCYFSSAFWRKTKQVSIDKLKQRARLSLLVHKPGQPLFPAAQFFECFTRLVKQLSNLTEWIHIIGLPPVDPRLFPGSRSAFMKINEGFQNSVLTLGIDYISCFEAFEQQTGFDQLFYRDGFHPSQAGAQFLAGLLHSHVEQSADIQ